MTRRRHQSIAIVALAVSLALPAVVAAREPGAAPIMIRNATARPAENTQGEDLAPLRGHEHAPVLLAQPNTVSTASTFASTLTAGSGVAPTGAHPEYLPLAVAIVATCWLCTLLARPRQPLPGNEVQELVYSRLLGRQHRLALLALFVTAITVFGALVSLASGR